MRNSMRRSCGRSALRKAIAVRTWTTQRTAPTTAGKIQQQPIAGRLYDPAAMLGDLRIDEFRAQPLEPAERALLVGPHEPAIAGPHRRLLLPPASGSRAARSREFTDKHLQPILQTRFCRLHNAIFAVFQLFAPANIRGVATVRSACRRDDRLPQALRDAVERLGRGHQGRRQTDRVANRRVDAAGADARQ